MCRPMKAYKVSVVDNIVKSICSYLCDTESIDYIIFAERCKDESVEVHCFHNT